MTGFAKTVIYRAMIVQWTLVNPDPVNPEPRKSEVQNQLIKFGCKGHVLRVRCINKGGGGGSLNSLDLRNGGVALYLRKFQQNC